LFWNEPEFIEIVTYENCVKKLCEAWFRFLDFENFRLCEFLLKNFLVCFGYVNPFVHISSIISSLKREKKKNFYTKNMYKIAAKISKILPCRTSCCFAPVFVGV
jgi:hypothetical protein